jgi:hypothetical protein
LNWSIQKKRNQPSHSCTPAIPPKCISSARFQYVLKIRIHNKPNEAVHEFL